VKRSENAERWQVPRQLEQKMIEIARQFRKEPTPSEAILWQALRKKAMAIATLWAVTVGSKKPTPVSWG
jgi:very-short-patch-repair endonuclease